LEVVLPDLRALRGLRPERPEDAHYHGWITLPGGLRGTISGPMLAAVARLGVPVRLEIPERPPVVIWADYWRFLPRLVAVRGSRGYRALVDPEARYARKPAGFAHFPEIGTVVKKDP